MIRRIFALLLSIVILSGDLCVAISDEPDSDKRSVVQHWASAIVLEEKAKTVPQKAVLYTGDLASTVSATSFYIFGQEFFARYLGEYASVPLGVCCVVPIALLGARSIRSITSTGNDKGYDVYQSRSKKRKAALVGLIGYSVIAGVPQGYMMWLTYAPYVSYGAVPLYFVGHLTRSAVVYWCTDLLCNSLYRSIRSNSIFSPMASERCIKLRRASNIIDLAIERLQRLPHQEVLRIASLFETDEESIERVSPVFSSSTPESHSFLYSIPKWFFSVFAVGVGSASVASTFPLTAEAYESAYMPQVMVYVGAAVAFSSMVILMGYSGKVTFDYLYDLFLETSQHITQVCKKSLTRTSTQSKKEVAKDYASKTVAVLFALVSAAPRAELAIRYLNDETIPEKLLLGVAAVGPFLMDYWLLKNAVYSVLDFNSRRSKLVGALEFLKVRLSRLKDSYLDDLLILFEQQAQEKDEEQVSSAAGKASEEGDLSEEDERQES